MNLIWTIIILFCFTFSLLTGNVEVLIDSLFDVPKESLNTLISLGSLIIIYNGIFQIAIDSNLITKISKLFKPIIKFIYCNESLDHEVVDLLSANFCANLIGLSAATTPIVLKLSDKLTHQQMVKLICMNVSCFSLFPFSIITLRKEFGCLHSFEIWFSLILITFISFIFGVIISKYGEK